MSSSYDLILDHIAHILHFLSDAPSFWFTLNTSYDHDFHLSKRFGMSAREYECLLIAADLASYTPKKGFAIKPKRWKSFITGHRFTNLECGNIELDSKQFDIDAMINGTPPDIKNRAFHHVIRIGVKYKDYHTRIEWQKDDLGRMVTTPPRLNGLWTSQQSFRKSVEPFIWNFIIDNDCEEEREEDQRHQSNHPAGNDELVLHVEEEAEPKSITPTPGKKKRKVNDSTAVNVPTYDNIVSEKYPHLSQVFGGWCGFDPSYPKTKKKMRSMLNELVDLLSSKYELTAKSPNNKQLTYVRVPTAVTD